MPVEQMLDQLLLRRGANRCILATKLVQPLTVITFIEGFTNQVKLIIVHPGILLQSIYHIRERAIIRLFLEKSIQITESIRVE